MGNNGTISIATCEDYIVLFPEDWRDESAEEVISREVLKVLEDYWNDSTEETKLMILYCPESETVYIVALFNWENYQELVVMSEKADAEKLRERLHI
jgi:hypothetical protein